MLLASKQDRDAMTASDLHLGYSEPTAVVLGGQQNGLGVIRSLARASIPTILVSADRRDIATVSRHCHTFKVSTFDGEIFIQELLKLRKRLAGKCVLICSDDRPLLSVSLYREQLAPYFDFELPAHQLLTDMGRKDRFYELAQRGGFPVPHTALVRNREDLQLLRNLRLPLCVKPNFRSQAYDGSFKKAYRLETYDQAHNLCERMLDVAEVIAQEWIEGSNDSIYFSLCHLDGSTPTAFTGRKARSWPPQIGYTASCWAAPEVAEELEDLTIRFFYASGITTGLASMEFKQDQRNGRFFMVEPTVGRADRQVEISAFCGVNLCHLAYCAAAELPRPASRLDPTHVWRDEFTDLAAARLLGTSCFYPRGYQIHNAHWRWDDPAPAFLVAAEYARKALRRVTNWRRQPSL